MALEHHNPGYDLSVYGEEFFKEVEREGCLMAPWFVPLLDSVFHFRSLVDVGCGTGYYIAWIFHTLPGRSILGIEGAAWAVENSMAKGFVVLHDLRTPFLPPERYDLAISIEVAEHIEEEFVNTYVRTLCELSDTVLITAAHPGQGGTKHVNVQPKGYWMNKFGELGFGVDAALTTDIRDGIAFAESKGEYVTPWFKSNAMVFRKSSGGAR